MINSFVRLTPALFCFVAIDIFAAQLITVQEAALPLIDKQTTTRGISRGPTVKVNSPQLDPTVTTPFDLKVSFEPRGESKIDPNSIRVTYLKSPAVDLTPRIKSGISTTGIDFPKAEVPPGTHPIRISVKDTEGRETNTTLNLVVAK